MDNGHYLVVGLGKTGHAIAGYLARCGKTFVMFDSRSETEHAASFAADFPSIPIYLGTLPLDILAEVSAVITSPGVPNEVACLQKAKDLHLPIYGDIECLARVLDAPVLAITGTNGKSTVTTLVGLMAQAAGFKTAVAGNIGTPVLDLLADDTLYDLWVLELSSFQLEVTSSLHPKAATILNVTPDHLDRHRSMEAYIAAKQRIYQHAEQGIFNRQDSHTVPLDPSLSTTSFGLDAPSAGHWGITAYHNDAYLSYGNTRLLPVSALRIKGRHNWENALAACALAHSVGISFTAMSQVLAEFPGLPHRSQWVRTLDAVDWINDSKGTNIGATQSTIAGIGDALHGKIVLIAGGRGKGADFSLLRDTVATYVRHVVLLGEDADKLDQALRDVVAVTRVLTLEEAVNTARPLAQAGDVVLLSPACASWDMFRDFNQRGEIFTSLVNRL